MIDFKSVTAGGKKFTACVVCKMRKSTFY